MQVSSPDITRLAAHGPIVNPQNIMEFGIIYNTTKPSTPRILLNRLSVYRRL